MPVRMKLTHLLAAPAALLLAILAPVSNAAEPFQGSLLFNPGCKSTGLAANIDPLVGWGQDPFGHTHGFFGPRVVNQKRSRVTTADLLASVDTTCPVESQKVLIWTPTIVKDGVHYRGGAVLWYYLKPAYVSQISTKLPSDFRVRFILGNPTATQPSSQNRWSCGTFGTVQATIPTSCPVGTSHISVSLYGGLCLDGIRFGPGFGTSGGPANGRDHVQCGVGYTERIPQLLLGVNFPAAAAGGKLSSDGSKPAGTTWHVDYVPEWGPDPRDGQPAFPKIVSQCLNRAPGAGQSLSCALRPRNDGSGKYKVIRPDTGATVTF